MSAAHFAREVKKLVRQLDAVDGLAERGVPMTTADISTLVEVHDQLVDVMETAESLSRTLQAAITQLVDRRSEEEADGCGNGRSGC